MNTKCLNCDKEISQTNGKRERLYCSDNCRAEFNQKKKVTTKRVLLSDWVKLEAGELPPEWVEKYFKKYPERLITTKSVANKYDNSINSIDANAGNVEVANKALHENVISTTKQDEINKLKGELALVIGKSDIAAKRRNFLQKQIDKLENS